MSPHSHAPEHGRHPHLVPLRFLPRGAQAVIVGYAPTHQSYRSKLLSMGLTKGTTITVKNVAPLGDPVHISVRDFDVSLRADEAEALLLQPIDGEEWGIPRGRGGLRRGRRRKAGWPGPVPHHHGQPHEGWPEHWRNRSDRRKQRWMDKQVKKESGSDNSGDE